MAVETVVPQLYYYYYYLTIVVNVLKIAYSGIAIVFFGDQSTQYDKKAGNGTTVTKHSKVKVPVLLDVNQVEPSRLKIIIKFNSSHSTGFPFVTNIFMLVA